MKSRCRPKNGCDCWSINSLAVSVIYLVIFSLQQIDQLKSSSYSSPELTQKIYITKRSEIYSKTVIQAVRKGAAKSGSPTLDGQGEKKL